LEEAIDLYGRPEVFNRGQGSQFASFDFISVLKENKIKNLYEWKRQVDG
jgi:hypothetical protein